MKDKEAKPKYRSSLITLDKQPIEMIYDKELRTTKFVGLVDGEVREYDDYPLDPRFPTAVPYPPDHKIIEDGLVKFPSFPAEYSSEAELYQEVRTFVHKYLDVSPLYEQICSWYVLFTWVFDCFNELPYLRVIGDYGSGKSRFLQAVGNLCYKPIFANGATTVSPIFRLIDEFQGTLVIDEADFSQSDAYSEIIKILNSGHSKGMPVIRSEGGSDGKSFEPRSFKVFGAKLIATRNFYKDKALESRCLVEVMGQTKIRPDIPINLPDSFELEALKIRNKLLMFRLRNYGHKTIKNELVDHSLEPRLNQIIVPLASIIDDEKLIADLKASVAEYSVQMSRDRGMEFDGVILEAIFLLLNEQGVSEPTVGDIKEKVLELTKDETDKKVTARGIGSRLRQSFKLQTVKTRDGYILPSSERDKLERHFQRYGLVNNVNIVNDEPAIGDKPAKDMSTEEIEEIFNT